MPHSQISRSSVRRSGASGGGTPGAVDSIIAGDGIGITSTGPGGTGDVTVNVDFSNDNPLVAGTAAPGTGVEASRDDHVHPSEVVALGLTQDYLPKATAAGSLEDSDIYNVAQLIGGYIGFNRSLAGIGSYDADGANPLVLAETVTGNTDSNFFNVKDTGSTYNLQRIKQPPPVVDGFSPFVTLSFAGPNFPTLVTAVANSGVNSGMDLAGGVDWTPTSAKDTITLQFGIAGVAGQSRWTEVARSTGSVSSVLWNTIGNPNGNQALTMGTTTTTQTWTAAGKLNYLVSEAVDDTVASVAKLSHHNTGSFSGSGQFGALLEFWLNDEDNATDVAYGQVGAYHATSESAQDGELTFRSLRSGVMLEFAHGSQGGFTLDADLIISTGRVAKFTGTTSGYARIIGPNIGDNATYTLPDNAPTTSGQFLQSTTAGVMSWSSYATALTNAYTTGSTQTHTTSGTAAAGFGIANFLELESAGGTTRQAVRLAATWTTATNAAEVAAYRIGVMVAGALPAAGSEQYRFGTACTIALTSGQDFNLTCSDFVITGRTLVPAGTAGNPSINNPSSGNTGIYWPTTTTFGISVGGAVAAIFDTPATDGHTALQLTRRVSGSNANARVSWVAFASLTTQQVLVIA